MAAMPVLKPLHVEAGLRRWSSAPTRRCRAAGGAGVAELDEQVRKVVDGAPALTFDGDGGRVPGPDEVRRGRSPST